MRVVSEEKLDAFCVRKMTREDIPEVASLDRRIFSTPWSERGFLYALDLEENLFLVAQNPGGRIVGYCGMYVSLDEGEITNVAVDEAKRRQGIGDALLAGILEMAARQGVRQIYLEARVSNEAAIRLYEKHGFSPCGTRRDFYRFPTEDALCLALVMH